MNDKKTRYSVRVEIRVPVVFSFESDSELGMEEIRAKVKEGLIDDIDMLRDIEDRNPEKPRMLMRCSELLFNKMITESLDEDPGHIEVMKEEV